MLNKLIVGLALLAAFAVSAAAQAASVMLPTQKGEKEMSAKNDEEPKTLVTIAFHGLMIFRHDERRRRFEVGIIKGAPDHVFVIVDDKPSIKKTSCPADQKVWRFEVRNEITGTRREGARRHAPTNVFRRLGTGNRPDDIRWMVDFDADLHKATGGTQRRTLRKMFTGMFKPILHVTVGKVYALCTTVSMDIKQGEGEFKPFGKIAEVVGVDIELGKGDKLYLTVGEEGEGSSVLLASHSPEGGHKGIYVINLPVSHLRSILLSQVSHSHGAVESTEKQIEQASHFQNYYLLFPTPPSERFELKLSEGIRPPTAACQGAGDKLMRLLDMVIASPDPYRCFEMAVSPSRQPLK